MSETDVPPGTLTCVRCGKPGREPISRPPFPNELGQRLVSESARNVGRVEAAANALDQPLRTERARPASREFLVTNLRAFLFAEGDEQAEIDTSREGDVNW